ncbi:MAG: phosphatidylserine decarboxylase family protein [Bacteroidales bacterium]|nr:phosphatidylserine decarboxylase family protein [Bacteroidales bacterium]
MPTVFILIFLIISGISSLWYYYLHKKTHISISFLYKDNLIVIGVVCLLTLCGYFIFDQKIYSWAISLLLIPAGVLIFSFTLTMIRFWRTPKRKITALEHEIVSPADGNIIYIKRIKKGETPVSIKKGTLASLEELTKTPILQSPCWLIGINMTPFDVHKNCAPVSGKIVLNTLTPGAFMSLKDFDALTKNERNTLVIQNNKITVGVVQTASRLVRRIVSYVSEGKDIKKGEWFGMIRFGSQVDLIIPDSCTINVSLKEQVYAGKTIMATLNNEHTD